MIRVAYIDHTARWSGGEVALYHLLSNMDRDNGGIEPLVILAEEGPLGERLRECGIRTYVLPLDDSVRNRSRHRVNAGLPGSVYKTLQYSRRLARLLREERVDCVHTNSLKAAIYGALAAKLARLPLIWHIRDQIRRPYLRAFVAYAIRLLARRLPDGIIANSKSTLETLGLPRSTGRKQKRLVLYSAYSGRIGRESGQPDRTDKDKAINREADDFIVLMAGRIDDWKGHDILLEAARHFKTNVRVKFWIAGDALFGQNEFKKKLLDFIEDEKLTHVSMLGHVNDMERLMRRADVLVHASVTPEPFGQVIVEGMAAGLPVIASNEGGPTEIVVHGETGLLIAPRQPLVLRDAIQWMLDHPEQRAAMGDAGMRRVEERFSIRHTVLLLSEFYPELTGRRPDGATDPQALAQPERG